MWLSWVAMLPMLLMLLIRAAWKHAGHVLPGLAVPGAHCKCCLACGSLLGAADAGRWYRRRAHCSCAHAFVSH